MFVPQEGVLPHNTESLSEVILIIIEHTHKQSHRGFAMGRTVNNFYSGPSCQVQPSDDSSLSVWAYFYLKLEFKLLPADP